VWFEMCPGYLAATQQVADDRGGGDWRDYWTDHDADIVQFFGFDNGYFHALLFPALLMAYDASIRLPSAFATNEFYLLDGEKFSSSREHAVWAREFAVTQPADWVRFYLSADRPEHARTNFTNAGFDAVTQHELQQRWLDWLTGVGRRVVEVCDGRAPGTGPYTATQKRFFNEMTGAIRRMEDAFDHTAFSPPTATRVLCEFVRTASSFEASQTHLIGVPGCGDELSTGLALELAAARLFATIAAPIVPDLSSRLWSALGFGVDGPTDWEPAPVFVPSGQYVSGLTDLRWGEPAQLPDVTPRTTQVAH
jgi:methionyl-tRNA synthetase